MPRQAKDLDTPFRRGEQVLAVRDLRGATQGQVGNVRLINGLSDYNGGTPWVRYWVKFDDGTMLGHINHTDLVRPRQLKAWQEREDERAAAALAAATASANAASDAPVAAAEGAAGLTGDAALIPPHLLERSKAAKARLLG